MTARLRLDADAEWLTTSPLGLDVAVPCQPALSALRSPTPVTRRASVDEPFVPVAAAERVYDLAAYHLAGWEEAVPTSVLRHSAQRRLAMAAAALPAGFGIGVFDGWRPPALQGALYLATYAEGDLDGGYVTAPNGDPENPPPHTTGGAVDATLTWRGIPLRLGTGFDDFSPRAHRDAFERQPGLVRSLRRLLDRVMSEAGWVPYEMEWWHFEFATVRWAEAEGAGVRYPGCTVAPAEALRPRVTHLSGRGLRLPRSTEHSAVPA